VNGSLRASYTYCGELARREARNFYYSFLLLPPQQRRSMCALYAFLRRSDDLADGQGSECEKRQALESWRRDLDLSLAFQDLQWPGFLALSDTVHRHKIPHKYLHDLLDGVAMDVSPRVYATFNDLYGYCYHVASVVGLSCLSIWGYRQDEGRAEKLAEACGVALQLTNILRDVREDAQIGRVYLPREDLERFGVAPEELSAARLNDRMRSLFAFEAQRAYDYYDQAAPLMNYVSPVGRPVLSAIVGIYRALLDEIARRDYDVLGARVALPAWRKTAITVRSLGHWFDRPSVVAV
jgi:15-cis-phytoene synthase